MTGLSSFSPVNSGLVVRPTPTPRNSAHRGIMVDDERSIDRAWKLRNSHWLSLSFPNKGIKENLSSYLQLPIYQYLARTMR